MALGMMGLRLFREMMGESGPRLNWKAESTGSVPVPLLLNEAKGQLTSPCLSFPIWKIRFRYFPERV